MKYTLDTLPVLDAFQATCECPLCRLRIVCEDQYIDSLLSSAYMEPETRKLTNEKGFCTRHFEMLFSRRNRLGLALMTHTHMQAVVQSLENMLRDTHSGSGGWFGARRSGSADTPAKIRARISGCALCEQIDHALSRYAYTIAYLFGTNAEFKPLFDQSKGFCLPHLALLIETADDALSATAASAFKKALAALELDNLRRIEGELEWFTKKFDYRNDDKPWGNSRDAVERSINKLMGACVGEEAQPLPHNS